MANLREKKQFELEKLVDKNWGVITPTTDVMLADGDDDGEYFNLIAIKDDGRNYVCEMDCDSGDWLLDDLTDAQINELYDEFFG